MQRAVLLAYSLIVVPLIIETTVAQAACPTVHDAPALIERMEQGGFVLVFRHADRYAENGEPRRPVDLGHQLPPNCEDTAQVLTDQGIAQAKAIGESLKTVPIGNVFATTACRTMETAQYAFGGSQTLTNALAQAIQSLPASGKNTVIVSHSSTIKNALAALDPSNTRTLACGEAAVIDPTADDGRPECVALVLPREWNPANGPDDLGWLNTADCKTR